MHALLHTMESNQLRFTECERGVNPTPIAKSMLRMLDSMTVWEVERVARAPATPACAYVDDRVLWVQGPDLGGTALRDTLRWNASFEAHASWTDNGAKRTTVGTTTKAHAGVGTVAGRRGDRSSAYVTRARSDASATPPTTSC